MAEELPALAREAITTISTTDRENVSASIHQQHYTFETRQCCTCSLNLSVIARCISNAGIRTRTGRTSRRQLITASARASSGCGIVSPSAFAVFRLIMSSNFVGCSTASSAGLAPFRILSTYAAARPMKSDMFIA